MCVCVCNNKNPETAPTPSVEQNWDYTLVPAIRVRGRQRGGWCESIEMKGRWEGGDERAAWRERVRCGREGGRERGWRLGLVFA